MYYTVRTKVIKVIEILYQGNDANEMELAMDNAKLIGTEFTSAETFDTNNEKERDILKSRYVETNGVIQKIQIEEEYENKSDIVEKLFSEVKDIKFSLGEIDYDKGIISFNKEQFLDQSYKNSKLYRLHNLG